MARSEIIELEISQNLINAAIYIKYIYTIHFITIFYYSL